MKDKGNDIMNALITMSKNDPATMNAIMTELADFTDIDNLDTWTGAAILQALRDAKKQRRADEVNRRFNLSGIDWQSELDTFLTYAKSKHTRRAYTAAMRDFETWAVRKGIDPRELSPAAADSYIYDMKAKTPRPASATIRRDVAALSAFYSFLERNTDGKVKNPIRGTKQRPPKENKKIICIPEPDEYKVIIDNMPDIEKAVILCLALRGLRIGALPTLERMKSGKYSGISKGSALKENGTDGITLPTAVLEAITAAGLDIKKPFAWETIAKKTAVNAAALESRINKHIRKLYKAGIIRTVFSCHDFRHYFAVQEYKKTGDILRVSRLLGHKNIAITDVYLKSLGVEL